MLPATGKSPLVSKTQLTVQSGLAVLSILLGIASISAALYTTFHTLIRFPYEDMWNIVEELGMRKGHLTLALLWSQHNEHRIPFARLLQAIDLMWFQGRNNSLYFEIYVLQFFSLFVWTYAMRKVAAWQTWLVLVGCGLAAFALFSISQFQSLTPLGVLILPGSGFGAVAVFAVALAIVSPTSRLAWLIAGIAAAFVCEGTLANGMLLWPLLVILAVKFRLSRNTCSLLGGAGAVAILLYLWSYESPKALASPLQSFSHPAALIQYLLTYLGAPWFGFNSQLARGIALLGIAFVSIFYFIELLRTKPRIFPLSVLSIGIFTLLSGIVTAVGRVSYGSAQALSSRYESMILLFWLCVTVYVLHVSSLKRTRLAMLAAMAALVADSATLPTFQKTFEEARAYTRRLDEGALPIFSDVRDPGETQNKLYVPFQWVYEQQPWLQSLHTAYYADPKYLNLDRPLLSVFHVTESTRCFGAVEQVAKLPDQTYPGWSLTGWAWDSEKRTPVEEIVGVNGSQVVIGSGLSAIPRPDLLKTYSQVTNANSGWHAYLRGSQIVDKYAIYGVVDGGRSACLVAKGQL